MKKWSNSTKIIVGLAVLLVLFVVARSVMYRRMAHLIAHQAASQAAVDAERKLILQGKLARVFKDSTNHAKFMAIRTAQLFAADTTMVEVEDHHMTMAEAAAGSLVEFLSDMELTVRAAAADALGRMGKPAAKPLIEVGLNSPDKDVRSNSTRALTMIGEVAVPELIEAVKGGKPTQKVGAATALGDLQTARAISALIGALSAKEVDVRLTCRDALVTLNGAAVQPLIGALGDKSPFTRRHAAEALGEIGDPAAALPLLNLINDEHRLVRLAATYSVGKVKDARAVPVLIARLDDHDREMREAAAVSLGQLADQRAVARLIRGLSDAIEAVREQAAAALGRIKPTDPAQMALIEAETGAGLEGARAAAVLALGQIGSPRSVAAVSARLQASVEPSTRVRRRAAAALGKMGSPAAIPHLLAAFGDPDWRVNYAAQDALAELGDPAAPALLQVMGSGQPLPAHYARKALLKMEPARALAALSGAVASPNPRLRTEAVLGLAELRTPEALQLLGQVAAQDPDVGVRQVAARTLAVQPAAEAPATVAPAPPAASGEAAPAE